MTLMELEKNRGRERKYLYSNATQVYCLPDFEIRSIFHQEILRWRRHIVTSGLCLASFEESMSRTDSRRIALSRFHPYNKGK